MILVNQVEESKRNEIISLLKDKSLGIKLQSDKECLDLYYQTFKNLKRICNGKLVLDDKILNFNLYNQLNLNLMIFF